TLGWRSPVDLEGAMSAALDSPVIVANDAKAAALAEYTFGGAADNMMLVRAGVGLGAGVIAGGSLILGARYTAGEIGHVIVGADVGPRCTCGKCGCLEAWVSVHAITDALDRI